MGDLWKFAGNLGNFLGNLWNFSRYSWNSVPFYHKNGCLDERLFSGKLEILGKMIGKESEDDQTNPHVGPAFGGVCVP